MKCPNCGDDTRDHTDWACRVCLVELAQKTNKEKGISHD